MDNEKYILAFDVGTSSLKAVMADMKGNIAGSRVEGYPSHMPQPGWMEQEPADYWNATVKATKSLLSETHIDPGQVAGMVFTTQAMGIIPVDKEGHVLRRNITWVDGRAQEEATWFMNRFGGKRVFMSIIGIEITGKDVLPKLRWLKKKEPEIYAKADKILDVNGYLKFRATGRKVFEWSGACSYTFDLKKKYWTSWLFRMIGFDMAKLPELVRSTDIVGGLTEGAAEELGLQEGMPVFGGCDDTQSAAVGSGATGENEAHIYLGTSAWVGLITSRIHSFKHGAVCLQSADPAKNIIVGITESAGSNIDWLIKNFYAGEQKDPAVPDVYRLANEEASLVSPGSDQLIFTPWLFGERCPVATTTTRGTIFNLGQHHSRAHLMRAMSEGIAYNLRWIIMNLEKDYKIPVPRLRIIGGGTQSENWMQMIADITNREVITTSHPKMAGALGAAMCAFVGLGVIQNFSEVTALVSSRQTYTPEPERVNIYNRIFPYYREIFKRNKTLYRTFNAPTH